MKRKPTLILPVLVATISAIVIGCGGGSSSNSSNPVTIQKANGYYNVTLDYANTTHREMGRQLALAVNNAMPDYAKTVDEALAIQMAYLELAPIQSPLKFEDIVKRAKALYDNPAFYRDYKDEIEGMQTVFNSDVDKFGDGILSKNELLVFQLFPDVMRPYSCSASAAFGNASASGKTILGRNLDWVSDLDESAAKLHSLTAFKNGSKTVANFGILGQLAGVSIFNTSRVFGAILDADLGVPYPTTAELASRRSYIFDLRYALENFSTLNGVSNFMGDSNHLYAYNHLVFVADQTSAGALENQVNNPTGFTGNRRLRTDTSTLQPLPGDQTWGILGAFATVNDYRLVGNFFTDQRYNTSRWTSYKSKYAGVLTGQKVDVNTMKAIAGYPAGTGEMDQGAIFVSEPPKLISPNATYIPYSVPGATGNEEVPPYTTIQSIIVDMATMEFWAHFVPPKSSVTSGVYPPREATYQKIPNPIY